MKDVKSIIPCLFTAGNLGFGVLSMIMTLQHLYLWAGICILMAMFCDACDGRVARALGVAGDFGKELDSLSDVVSFGAASAFLIYAYSLQYLGGLGAIPAILYACLGGIRLARFNLTTSEIHGYFQGMPIPNGGALIATYVIASVWGDVILPAWILGVIVLLLGLHLVSNIHNPNFKEKSPDKLNIPALVVTLIIGALILWLVNWHLIITMPFLLYIIFGLLNTAENYAAAR